MLLWHPLLYGDREGLNVGYNIVLDTMMHIINIMYIVYNWPVKTKIVLTYQANSVNLLALQGCILIC